MPNAPTTPAKLTDKQQRFVEEYCVDWNGTQAAIRAGYAAKAAHATGWENLRKPEIKAAIDARMLDLSLSAGQTTKLISDIAETRLNDFMVVREVQGYALENTLVSELVARLESEIDYINSFMEREGLRKKEQGPFKRQITERRKKLLEYQLELDSYGPDTRRLVPGRPVVHQAVELDLVAIATAERGGRVKAWTPTEHGIKVEMYDASAALRDMGRVHGIFEKDNDQNKPTAVLNATVEVISSGVPVARSEKEAAANV
jgi:phage terminase small subunit